MLAGSHYSRYYNSLSLTIHVIIQAIKSMRDLWCRQICLINNIKVQNRR